MKKSKILLISIITLLTIAVIYELSLQYQKHEQVKQQEVKKKIEDSLIVVQKQKDSLAIVEANKPTDEEIRKTVLADLAREVSPFIGYEFNIFTADGKGRITFNIEGQYYEIDLEGVNFYYKDSYFVIVCKNVVNELTTSFELTGYVMVDKNNYDNGCLNSTYGKASALKFKIQNRSENIAQQIIEGINEYYHLFGYSDNLELLPLPTKYNYILTLNQENN